MASFLAPVNGLVNLAGTLQEVQGAVRRLDDVLQHQQDPIFAAGTAKKDAKVLGRGRREELQRRPAAAAGAGAGAGGQSQHPHHG